MKAEQNNGYCIYLTDKVIAQRARISYLEMRLKRREYITKGSWFVAALVSIAAGAKVCLY